MPVKNRAVQGVATRDTETCHVTVHSSNQLKYFTRLFQDIYMNYFCLIFETFGLVYQVNIQQSLSRRTNICQTNNWPSLKTGQNKKIKIWFASQVSATSCIFQVLLALLQDLATPRFESRVSERCWHMLYFTLPHSPNCRGWESPLV